MTKTERRTTKQVGPSLMDRTRAAVRYISDARGGDEELKMGAFLALFHPEIDLRGPKGFELLRDARERNRRR